MIHYCGNFIITTVPLHHPFTQKNKLLSLELFNFTVEFLKTKLKYLKDNLKKCLDRRSKVMRSGATASKLATCKYFDQLSFLHNKVSNKPTESNLTPVIEVDDAASVLENPYASTVTQSVPSSTISTMTSALRKGISSSAPGKKNAESELIPYTPPNEVSQELTWHVLLVHCW